MESNQFDVIVIGGGPAGLTAGIYLARAKAKALIIDTGITGGQTVLTYEVANYPGVEMTSGYALSSTMRKQAESFGCKVIDNATINNLSLKEKIKTINVNGTNYESKAISLSFL